MFSVFPMVRGALLSVLMLAALMLAAGACGSKQPATAPPSFAKTEAAATASAPNDLSPNKLHDRRAEEGVRSPPKPLVLENAKSVKCGKITKGADSDEMMDLLSGRIRVRAPGGAKAPAPLENAPPIEEESRIVVDGPQKLSLAIVARETFQLDPDLYEPEADAPIKPASLDIEAPKFLKAVFGGSEGGPLEVTPVEIGSGSSKMRAYAARPPQPNATPGKDTALVLALLLVQDDGALQTVGFYVRGEPVRNATGTDLVGCTRLAERIGSSLAPGPRKLERAAGRRHVADIGNDEELTLTVPQDYVAVPAHGTNGARVIKMRPLSLYAGSISIVVGVDSKGVPDGVETKAPGKLLGHPIEWRGKSGAKGGFFFADSPIDSGSRGAKEKAEVLVKATRQAKFLDEMRGVAETLAVTKRAK